MKVWTQTWTTVRRPMSVSGCVSHCQDECSVMYIFVRVCVCTLAITQLTCNVMNVLRNKREIHVCVGVECVGGLIVRVYVNNTRINDCTGYFSPQF